MSKQDSPAKAEAKGKDISVPFEGVTYVITRENADDVEIYERVEDGNYITAVRGFLGAEQWEKFKDAHRVDGRVSMTAFNAFLDAAMDAVGNRNASPDS